MGARVHTGCTATDDDTDDDDEDDSNFTVQLSPRLPVFRQPSTSLLYLFHIFR
jgi:hypothetical protein